MDELAATLLEDNLPVKIERENDYIWIGTQTYSEEQIQKIEFDDSCDFFIALHYFPHTFFLEKKHKKSRSNL